MTGKVLRENWLPFLFTRPRSDLVLGIGPNSGRRRGFAECRIAGAKPTAAPGAKCSSLGRPALRLTVIIQRRGLQRALRAAGRPGWTLDLPPGSAAWCLNNRSAIVALVQAVEGSHQQAAPHAGHLPDYLAPIVVQAEGRRVVRNMRWGLPSSEKSLFEAAVKRADVAYA